MKIGIAIYHSQAQRYPQRWKNKCINSLIHNIAQLAWDDNPYFYELDYGDTPQRFHTNTITGFVNLGPRYRRKKLANYAEAMNEIYSWIFEECDVVCNANIDDYYAPDRILKLVETLNAGADVASSNYIMVDENDMPIAKTDYAELNLANELARDNNIVSNPGHMMKKQVFEKLKFDPSLVPREDLQYWKDCLGAGFKIVIRPEHLHYYRIHPGQSGNQK
jgi:hypothetical protein